MKTILTWLRAVQDSSEPINVDCTLKTSWDKIYDRTTGTLIPRRTFEITIRTNDVCVSEDQKTGTIGRHRWEFRDDLVSRKELSDIKAVLKKVLPQSITASTGKTNASDAEQ